MSPHAVITPTISPVIDEAITKEFAVTENGFLPKSAPSKRLSDSYYAPWERLAYRLPLLIQEERIRCEVDLLPVLSVDNLRSEEDWRRAYVILTFLTHGYIWGGQKAAEILPPAITVPLLKISSHLELPPVATYAGLALWNFASPSSSFEDVESLKALLTFTGTEDESWFYMVSVAMECQGAQVISKMLRALEALRVRDLDSVSAALEWLPERFRTIGDMLDRMHERCDPMVFYHDIRPFLAGTKNMSAAGLPRGVFFDEGDGKGKWTELRGGSNGQSSLIQFFDEVLGVEHKPATRQSPTGKKEEVSYHEEVRGYMPGPHRRFLEHLPRLGSIRNYVAQIADREGNDGEAISPEEARLRVAYKGATAALTEFRNRHLNLVARFIILPARQGRNGPGRPGAENLASASSALARQKGAQAELTGTGGTALLPFLKHVRDETWRAGSEIK
ncbi:uncharacterized protein E0L32_003391 [Thyridium curvatum]|uniref:Indoleamine 2,3-dioxygenase n=1 Tax=Thyridium curvatum TaxID=1093900 RepID=A0A507BHL3_9PEZI|nr:uncharacterized protein E0L32_003391 [Thyridium curvatum]TPX16829.1 hypothetical protein E0L32_003391 [Thyridium curvatum]